MLISIPPVTGLLRTASLGQLLEAEQPVATRTSASPAMPPPVWQVVLLSGLLLWLYFSTLSRLFAQWWHDPNFSHGFFVPLFAAFVLWQERSRLATVRVRPSWSGFFLLLFGLCVLVLGQMGAELFLSRLSLLIVIAGLIVLLAGWSFF